MIEYKSTIAQMEVFLTGNVWADMLSELSEWKKDIEGGYPQCETLKQLGEVNGRLEAVAYILALPHALLGFLRERAQRGDEPEEEIGEEDLD